MTLHSFAINKVQQDFFYTNGYQHSSLIKGSKRGEGGGESRSQYMYILQRINSQLKFIIFHVILLDGYKITFHFPPQGQQIYCYGKSQITTTSTQQMFHKEENSHSMFQTKNIWRSTAHENTHYNGISFKVCPIYCSVCYYGHTLSIHVMTSTCAGNGTNFHIIKPGAV